MKVEEIKGGFVHWYSLIKEYTPHSQYIKVSDDDFNVILAKSYDIMQEHDLYIREAHSRPKTGLTREEEVNRLNEIAKELDPLFEGGKKFFRTDILSPKDTGDCVVDNGEAAIRLLCQSYCFYHYASMLKRYEGLHLILRDVTNYSEEYQVFVVNGAIIKISQEEKNKVGDCRLSLNSFGVDRDKEVRIKAYVENILKESGIEYGLLNVGVTDTDQLMVISCFID